MVATHVRVRSKSSSSTQQEDEGTSTGTTRLRGKKVTATKESVEYHPIADTSTTSIDESKRRPLSTFKDYECFRNHQHNSNNRFTVKAVEMPAWYFCDSFINEGYRRITFSWRGCLLSLSYLHNESGNVYTHGIGALFCLPLAWTLYTHPDWMSSISSNRSADYLVLGCYLIGLMACLSLSTMFHLCCCHSKRVSIFLNKCDYVGIVALQTGSFIPALYYGFFCDPFYQILYMVSIVTLGVLTIFVTVGPQFASAEYRWLRTGLFSLFGGLGVVPALHHLTRYGYEMAIQSFGIEYVISMGACYLIGAFIYAYRIPERWFPGKFDLIGHSHQIWHCFVLLAAGTHFAGIFNTYKWWHNNNNSCFHSDEQMISWFSN